MQSQAQAGAIATIRVSVDSDGNQVTGGSSTSPFISDNGRYVVFQSLANNLVDDDTNGLQDIFVHDRDADGDGKFDEQDAEEADEAADHENDDGNGGGTCFITSAAQGFLSNLFSYSLP